MAQAAQKVVALGLREYKNPLKIAKMNKSIRTQMMEIEGKVEFDKGNYHNQNYENLIKSLVQSREQYRQSENLQERQNISSQEYNLWKDYIAQRKEEVPEEYRITDKQIYELKQIWDLVKGRKQKTLSSGQILEFHNEYAKKFKFTILIDPKCMVQMIHPHHGYLNNFPGSFEFDQLLDIYNDKLVATIEREQGQDLLADEISSFVYWKQFDTESKGYMNNQEYLDFLRVFKFDLESIEDYKTEFQFANNLYKGEFNDQINLNNEGNHRFDFFRYLFLERNL